LCKMPFSVEDRSAIKVLRQDKQYGAETLLKMFPNNNWTLGGLKTLLRKIDATDSVERRSGSGRPRTVRVLDVIANVQDLVLNQENAPKTHSSQRWISRRTGVSLGCVNRIIRQDLRLTCLKRCRAHELTDANKIARRERCRNLLKQETPDFIPPTLWPPNSPDLNPVDYAVWGILQDRVYKSEIKDVEELRQRIQEEWDGLDQRVIDSAVRGWRKRLQACIAANGEHFKHKL